MSCNHSHLIFTFGGGVRCPWCGIKVTVEPLPDGRPMSPREYEDQAWLLIEAEAILRNTPNG